MGGDLGDFFEGLFGRNARATGATGARPRAGEDLEQEINVSLEEAYNGGSREFVIDVPEGTGRTARERIEVKIPPGILDGKRLRVAGKGHPGANNGPRGDLYLKVKLAPHPQFERRGDDLYTDVEVPVWIAALGGDVRIRTLTGNGDFGIPAGTQNGRTFRLRGQGMPKAAAGAGRGDLFVKVKLMMPEQLTDDERALFEQLRQLRGASPAAAGV